MISYLMSYPMYIVFWAFYHNLKALDCFKEFPSGDRAMARLELRQLRNSLSQFLNGILLRLFHDCNESNVRAQSMRCLESTITRGP